VDARLERLARGRDGPAERDPGAAVAGAQPSSPLAKKRGESEHGYSFPATTGVAKYLPGCDGLADRPAAENWFRSGSASDMGHFGISPDPSARRATHAEF
jgi:hypothetical protein